MEVDLKFIFSLHYVFIIPASFTLMFICGRHKTVGRR